MFECGFHAAMLATTHGTHVHEVAGPCDRKAPPGLSGKLLGTSFGNHATDGPPKFGPILKFIRKKVSILRPFFCRA
jgi:hypothetical protein